MTGARPLHAGYTGHAPATRCSPGPYSLVSGTSQAAPQVAGAAALVRDWYEPQRGAAPSPALTKALLINTATDLAGGRTARATRSPPVPTPTRDGGG